LEQRVEVEWEWQPFCDRCGLTVEGRVKAQNMGNAGNFSQGCADEVEFAAQVERLDLDERLKVSQNRIAGPDWCGIRRPSKNNPMANGAELAFEMRPNAGQHACQCGLRIIACLEAPGLHAHELRAQRIRAVSRKL
jgi:hypothetical protein